jgi:hypothetical protein
LGGLDRSCWLSWGRCARWAGKGRSAGWRWCPCRGRQSGGRRWYSRRTGGQCGKYGRFR